MDVTFLGGVNAIGGNKFLLTDGKDAGSRLLLDFGMQFGDPESYAKAAGPVSGISPGSVGAFFDEFLPPRTNASLRDLLKLKVLPEVDGLYRSDWLVTPGFRAAVKRHLGEVPLEDYWSTDLLSYDEFVAKNGRPFVDGVLLTHAHADHFQHLAFVDPKVPVYCTEVTRTVVKAAGDVAQQRDTSESYAAVLKSIEPVTSKGVFSGAYQKRHHSRNGKEQRPYHIVQPYEWFDVGAFRAQAIPIDHSVPGACFFLIEDSDGKRVLYTGDFRFHGVYEAASNEAKRRLRGLRPDALLCEGTRIDSDHQDAEQDVLAHTKQTIVGTKGLVLAEWSWKDATRFLTMQQAAEAAGRTLLVDPRLAYTLDRLAKVDRTFKPMEAYGNVAVYVRRKDTMTYSPTDYSKHELGYESEWDKQTREAAKHWWLEEDGAEAPRAVAHIANGVRAYDVQRDPSKYVVQSSFFQMNELFDLDPPRGSTYIRSACEPFNDEMVSDQSKLLNWLSVWDIDSNVGGGHSGHHTSGHASGKELAEFWQIVRPEMLFPIHTQHPERYEEWWPEGHVVPPSYGETITI